MDIMDVVHVVVIAVAMAVKILAQTVVIVVVDSVEIVVYQIVVNHLFLANMIVGLDVSCGTYLAYQ